MHATVVVVGSPLQAPDRQVVIVETSERESSEQEVTVEHWVPSACGWHPVPPGPHRVLRQGLPLGHAVSQQIESVPLLMHTPLAHSPGAAHLWPAFLRHALPTHVNPVAQLVEQLVAHWSPVPHR